MNEQATTPANSVSFKDYLLKNKRNKTILSIAAIAVAIQFSIFKYFYPFASYIHGDSFVYLQTAYDNLDINTYMVGYSKFLRFFSVFNRTDLGLTIFQYLLIQSSALLFLFTLFYFYKPGKIVQTILLCSMIFNPLFLHLANLVSSDGFFLALSLIWVTLLLWIIHRPNNYIIVFHGLVLYIAFTVRYNALIYPFISAGVFFLSKIPVRKRVFGITLGAVLCGLFVFHTGNKYRELTGIWQYSPFSGWQLANNAMYAYRDVDSADRKPVPKRFQVLDNMIREYFDSTRRDIINHPQEWLKASTVYMWDPRLSLFKYRDLQFIKDTSAPELKKWAMMGPFYADYGLYIIKQYPKYYAKYFLWPNANKYYAPPVEFLEAYNSGQDSTAEIAAQWFGYKNRKLTTRMKDIKTIVLNFYPILSGLVNAMMLMSLVCFAMLNGFRSKTFLRKGVLLAGTVWLINAGFTIGASSAALRFQAFPIMLVTTFSLLLTDWMCRLVAHKKAEALQSGAADLNTNLGAEAALYQTRV